MLSFAKRKQKFLCCSLEHVNKVLFDICIYFQACPQTEKDFLNVHIVPHSHDGKK